MTLVAGICFLLIPSELAFGQPEDLGICAGLFRFADRLNLTYNLVPSLHVALSVACIAVFAVHTGIWGRLPLWTWAIGIGLSTLLTHQHHVLDVVTGFALGIAGSRLVYDRLTGASNRARLRTPGT